jgi:hypothetical protein
MKEWGRLVPTEVVEAKWISGTRPSPPRLLRFMNWRRKSYGLISPALTVLFGMLMLEIIRFRRIVGE